MTATARLLLGRIGDAGELTLPVAAVADLRAVRGDVGPHRARSSRRPRSFTLGRFGEVDLSVGGRLDNPTNEVAPGAPAIALQDAEQPAPDPARRRHRHPEPRPVRYPQGGLSADNTLRVGDTLPSLTGVLGFGFSRYRVQPVGAIEFVQSNPRPGAPDDVGGEVRVAAFNVLNYFNGDGAGAGFPTARGATTPAEFDAPADQDHRRHQRSSTPTSSG